MKNLYTKTVSKTTTNLKLAVAAVALLGSIELALAAAPVQKAVAAPKPGACLATITQANRACRGGFRDYVFACPNGQTYSVPTLCRSRVSAQTYADSVCLKKKMCGAPPAQAPAAPVVVNNFPDIGFVGQPVVYKNSEGTVKVKVAYTNSGQVALPQENRQNYEVRITYLDANKQPIGDMVQSTGLFPLGPGEIGYLAWGVQNEAAALRFRLELGNSPVDNLPLDKNLLNNETTVPIPALDSIAFGTDPAPAQYADLVVSNVVVDSSASSSVSITIKNQGNFLSKLTGESLKVGFSDANHNILSSQLHVLPNLAPGATQRIVVPVNLNPRPATLFITIDPENTGNEPKFMEPNIMRENNSWSGPVFTPPSVEWANDTPSGVSVGSMGQLVGKFVISNPLTNEFPLEVHYFTFEINTNIQFEPGNGPMLRIYKDSQASQPIFESIIDPEMLVHQFPDLGGRLLISAGASKTIFVTLDTGDATSNKSLSIRLSPTNGMNWTLSNSWNSVFLNSESLRIKTLTY